MIYSIRVFLNSFFVLIERGFLSLPLSFFLGETMSLHTGKSTGALASVGTTYDAAKKIAVGLSYSAQSYFLANIKTIQLYLSSISDGAATKITFKLCTDATGDNIIIPNTEIDLDRGITTTTKGNATISIDVDFFAETETVYLFPKIDAGTVTIDNCYIVIEV